MLKKVLRNQPNYDSILIKSVEFIELETQKIGRNIEKEGEIRILNLISLDDFNSELNHRKRLLVRETLFLKKQYRQLKNLKESVVSQKQEFVKQKEDELAAANFKDQLADIKTELVKKDSLLRQQKDDMNEMKEELVLIREEISGLVIKVQNSETKITGLTEEVAGKSMEIIEKERDISNYREQVQTVADTLMEAQERLSLAQRIIQDKDRQVQRLEDKMAEFQVIAKQGSEQSKKNIEFLRNEFIRLEKSLRHRLTISDDKITALENLGAEQEQMLAMHVIEMQQKDWAINAINEDLIEKNIEIADIHNVIRSKDQKLIESNGIFQIYQAKLKDANTLLQEKIKRIEALEKDFTGVQHNITSSQIAVKRLYKQIDVLERKFSQLNVRSK